MKIKWYLSILIILTISIFIYHYVETNEQPSLKIGIVMMGDSRNEKFSGLQQGLQDLGYKKKEINFILKNANDQEGRLERQIKDLLKDRPNLIVTLGGIETTTLKAEMEKQHLNIPIVFAGVAAPREIGLIQDYQSPGGLLTGVNNYHTKISGKRLEILHDLVPSINRVLVLYDDEIEISRISLKETVETAKILSIPILPVNAAESDFLQSLQKSVRPNDAILILPGFRIESATKEIVALSQKYKIPTMGIYEHEVEQGFLASYGASFFDQGYQAARYVSLIIQGNSPGDLPVEVPDRIRFIINDQVRGKLGFSLNKNIGSMAETINPAKGEGLEKNE
ncbi:ABC transporter substrate-binding protein [Bacillus sp. FJAT-29953]|nr:ABC transporter substrate-binding protein [Bacillus sp. FJAT-29953]